MEAIFILLNEGEKNVWKQICKKTRTKAEVWM
jgi:hypothetical protein